MENTNSKTGFTLNIDIFFKTIPYLPTQDLFNLLTILKYAHNHIRREVYNREYIPVLFISSVTFFRIIGEYS